MLFVTCHGRARGHRAASTAGHHESALLPGLIGVPGSGADRVLRCFADWILRTGRHVVLHQAGAQQILADDGDGQLGAKAGGDCLGGFEGGKPMALCPDRWTRKPRTARPGPRSRNPLTFAAADWRGSKRQGPARPTAWTEQRSHQWKRAGGLHDQPGGLVGDPLPVQFGELPFQIVVDQRDRQVGGTFHDVIALKARPGRQRTSNRTSMASTRTRQLRRFCSAIPGGSPRLAQ